MAAVTPGDGDVVGGYNDLPGLGPDDHVGLDVSSSSYYSGDKQEEEEAPLSMDQREDCSSHVTFLNIYALLTALGYNFTHELYHMKNTAPGPDIEHGLDLIETNIKLQQLKKQYEDSLVLNLLVRATTTVSSQLAAVLYQPPIVYDLSEHDVFAVDDHGVVFQSQGSSNSIIVQPIPHIVMCIQESRNVSKGKLKVVFEEKAEEGYNSSDEDTAYDSDSNPFSLEQQMIDEASDEES
ncbi:hypothetical protein D1007_34312 [Hordeum vulgare]|nr:hypothetical protein D1007_34312 [Hordeum vulgare]